MDSETAREFTESLDQTGAGIGQAASGWWRQIAVGVRLNIPKALGTPRAEWTQERRAAIGNMQLREAERKQAVAELTAPAERNGEGLNNSQAADVLGVDEATVRRDRSANAEVMVQEAESRVEIDADESANAEPVSTRQKIATFNRVNDNIGWARWSWNPVTGCLHNCDYCYARDIAQRFTGIYRKGFEPDFWPERLDAPANTNLPAKANGDESWRRVFTCSMADLFGEWVPQEWITAVFNAIDQHRQWEYLCLTKFPQRLAQLEWPDNVWAGTTVDRQHRVAVAERAFSKVTAGVKWLSCEPLLEPLQFKSLAMFDWVVIGASTGSAHAQPFAPPFEWVVDLYQQARAAGCRVYLKHNLFGSNDGRGPGMEPVREWPR